MRDKHNRLFRFSPNLQQLGLHELPGLGVERGERFVHQHHDGVCRERSGEIDPLLHPTGEFRRKVPLEAGQADELDEEIRALLHRRCIEALLQLHTVPDIARNGAPRQQARVLKHNGAVDTGPGHTFAVNKHIALFVRKQSGNNVQQRCLAAAAGTDDRHKLALGDRK